MELKAAVQDIDLLRKIVAKETALKNDYAMCCFHQDKTPSLHIFVAKSGKPRFHCHGCGASGDVIDFVRRLHRFNFTNALDYISRIAETEIEYDPSPAAGGRRVSLPQGPGSASHPATEIQMPSSHDCITRCTNFLDFWDAYELALAENAELRRRLGIPDHESLLCGERSEEQCG